jgi:hypothetical protein
MDVIFITETNFILDIAFEQSNECERLLTLIREQDVKLVIPEYAFAEAEGTIVTIIQNRLAAIDSALNALKQSARSAYQTLDGFITCNSTGKILNEWSSLCFIQE